MYRGPQPGRRVPGRGWGGVFSCLREFEQSLECSEESVYVGIRKDNGMCKGPGHPGWSYMVKASCFEPCDSVTCDNA